MQHGVTADADIEEGGIGDDARDGALDQIAFLQVTDGLRAGFDERQADAIAIAIKLFDPGFDRIPFLQAVADLAHAADGKLGNVNQAVSADADVNECAEFGDTSDDAVNFHANAENFDHFFGWDNANGEIARAATAIAAAATAAFSGTFLGFGSFRIMGIFGHCFRHRLIGGWLYGSAYRVAGVGLGHCFRHRLICGWLHGSAYRVT